MSDKARGAFAVGVAMGVLSLPHPLWSANVREHLEGVRRKAPIVYVGVVEDVAEVERSKMTLRVRATLAIVTMLRGGEASRKTASLVYSTYDARTPPLEGGMQWVLKRGTTVVVFAHAFDDGPPAYVLGGQGEDPLARVKALRDQVRTMPAEGLKFHGITEEDRRAQIALYDALEAVLRSSKATR